MSCNVLPNLSVIDTASSSWMLGGGRLRWREGQQTSDSMKSRLWLKMVIRFPELSSTPHFFCLGGGL